MGYRFLINNSILRNPFNAGGMYDAIMRTNGLTFSGGCSDMLMEFSRDGQKLSVGFFQGNAKPPNHFIAIDADGIPHPVDDGGYPHKGIEWKPPPSLFPTDKNDKPFPTDKNANTQNEWGAVVWQTAYNNVGLSNATDLYFRDKRTGILYHIDFGEPIMSSVAFDGDLYTLTYHKNENNFATSKIHLHISRVKSETEIEHLQKIDVTIEYGAGNLSDVATKISELASKARNASEFAVSLHPTPENYLQITARTTEINNGAIYVPAMRSSFSDIKIVSQEFDDGNVTEETREVVFLVNLGIRSAGRGFQSHGLPIVFQGDSVGVIPVGYALYKISINTAYSRKEDEEDKRTYSIGFKSNKLLNLPIYIQYTTGIEKQVAFTESGNGEDYYLFGEVCGSEVKYIVLNGKVNGFAKGYMPSYIFDDAALIGVRSQLNWKEVISTSPDNHSDEQEENDSDVPEVTIPATPPPDTDKTRLMTAGSSYETAVQAKIDFNFSVLIKNKGINNNSPINTIELGADKISSAFNGKWLNSKYGQENKVTLDGSFCPPSLELEFVDLSLNFIVLNSLKKETQNQLNGDYKPKGLRMAYGGEYIENADSHFAYNMAITPTFGVQSETFACPMYSQPLDLIEKKENIKRKTSIAYDKSKDKIIYKIEGTTKAVVIEKGVKRIIEVGKDISEFIYYP